MVILQEAATRQCTLPQYLKEEGPPGQEEDVKLLQCFHGDHHRTLLIGLSGRGIEYNVYGP